MRSERKLRESTGFTLVELLVAITILGLLLGILLPALSVGRESARRIHCQSNLKQIGLSMVLYLEIEDEFPDAAMMHTVTPDLLPLTNFLLPHAENNEEIFLCPSDTEFFQRGERISYAYNRKIVGRTLAQFPNTPLSEVIVLFDYEHVHGPPNTVGSRNILYADGHVNPL